MHSEFTPLYGVMKVVLTSNKPSKALVVPPIPLIKKEEKAYAQGSYTTLKLRSNQAEDNSPIYEIQVPYSRVILVSSSSSLWTRFKL